MSTVLPFPLCFHCSVSVDVNLTGKNVTLTKVFLGCPCTERCRDALWKIIRKGFFVLVSPPLPPVHLVHQYNPLFNVRSV